MKYLPETDYKKALLLFSMVVFLAPAVLCCSVEHLAFDTSRIKRAGQLLVVVTDKIHQKSGKLFFFQKESGKWKKKLEPVDIMLGAHGMAWSEDLTGLFSNLLPRKKEGDLCSPAGVYALNEAFSFDSIPLSLKLLILKKESLCIDDKSSLWYNQIIDSSVIEKDWKTSEKMKAVPWYKYGLIIGNENGKSRGQNGSCIFVHIWSAKGRSTAGCTAMREEDLLRILKLLDRNFFPVIVQLPIAEYKKYKNRLGFPAI